MRSEDWSGIGSADILPKTVRRWVDELPSGWLAIRVAGGASLGAGWHIRDDLCGRYFTRQNNESHACAVCFCAEAGDLYME